MEVPRSPFRSSSDGFLQKHPLKQSGYERQFEEANRTYDKGLHTQALEQFASIVFDAIQVDQVDRDLIDRAMLMTITSYKKLREEAVQQIMLANDDDLCSQFFGVMCHYYDHREPDAETIQKEITFKLPLSLPEVRNVQFPQGEVKIENEKVRTFNITTITAQGPRDTMEDEHIIGELIYHDTQSIPIFAVFDGHGGNQCVVFVRDTIQGVLQEELDKCVALTDEAIYHALSRAFVRVHQEWIDLRDKDSSGTTATVAIIINDSLWVANVGDSRAVLIMGNEPRQLSEDAKPTIKKYADEIFMRGGEVKHNRVGGGLDMARSIGDADHPSVSARPTIQKFQLPELNKKEKNHLVIGCDGLWDVVSPQDAAQICFTTPSHEEAAVKLKDAAFAKGTYDNVTVMVIDLP